MISNPLKKYNINNFLKWLILSAFIGVSISFGDFYLFHFTLFISICVWIYQIKENGYVLNLKPFIGFHFQILGTIFFWYLISLIWAPSILLGIKYLFYLFCGILITLSVVNYCKSMDRLNSIFKSISFLITIEIIIALLESFSTFRMPISSYSKYSIYFNKDPINYDSSLIGLIIPPTGFHWNTNDFAICMVISLPFFLCSKNHKIRIAGILAITTLVIMTASRAAFFGLLLTYSLYLIIIKKKIGTLILTWLVSLIIILGMVQLRSSENPRINELANTIETATMYLTGEIDIGGSLQWRRKLIENGIDGLINSYGIGLGAGGSTANQEIIGPVAGRFTSMHNFWIEILVEGGVLIALTFYLWIGFMIYKLFLISKNINNNTMRFYSQSLLLALISFIPAAIAGSSTIYFFPMWIMFGFSTSVILLSNEIEFKNVKTE